jgi:hypothetical protein
MITNNARCTREMKSRIIMVKGAFNKKMTFFVSKLDLNLREKLTTKTVHLEYSFVWCWISDISGSRSEIRGTFLNLVLEKDGEDWLARLCEKWRSITQSQGGEEYPTYRKRKEANWIGHILRKKCVLKHVIEGNITGMEDEEENVTSYWLTLRKLDNILEIERGSTSWHCMNNSLWKRLLTIGLWTDRSIWAR